MHKGSIIGAKQDTFINDYPTAPSWSQTIHDMLKEKQLSGTGPVRKVRLRILILLTTERGIGKYHIKL
jgi:hypothetical protein